MKNIVYILLLTISISCGNSPEEKLQHLNGYWEIKMLDDGAGNIKEFGMSQNIDFFQMKPDGKGVRKKVQPNALGEFKAADASENIDATITDDNKVVLKFSTAYDTWQEKLFRADENTLILINEDHKIYTYRRYKPLVVN